MVQIDGREILRHRGFLVVEGSSKRGNSKNIKLELAGRVRHRTECPKPWTGANKRQLLLCGGHPKDRDGTVCLERKAKE